MPEVRDTQEYRRIAGLPRRRLNDADAAAWASRLTGELRAPGSTRSLRPWQGYAIAEAAGCGGAFLGLGVGHGKTDLSFVLPYLFRAIRPLIIVPGAGLRDKTYADFSGLLKHWRAPRNPRVITTQELAPERAAGLLETLAPDFIFIDECDDLANPRSAAARRIDRYLAAHPDVVVVCATGTPSRKSIMNYWHLMKWCLRERAPVPLVREEAMAWALALDHTPPGRPQSRMGPGPLGADRDAAREWYRQRLAETPGVVLVDGDSCDAPLTIRVRPAREDKRLDEEFALFLKGDINTGRPPLESPGGESVADPLSRWRLDGQLGAGLYLRWNPPPPTAWREARRAVAKFVRERIAATTHSARPLDTEAQVLRRHADNSIVTRWLAIRDTFVPVTEPVWISTSVIESVRDWLREAPGVPGIVWTGCVEFAEAASVALRLPYYGREGRERITRVGLHDADPRASMLASWHANKRGFNLQPWRRQLLVMPPQSAKYLEQIFGRSHRAGQEAHVIVDVLATSGGTYDLVEAAISEAGFARDTVGMTQKLLRARVEYVAPSKTATNAYRWGRKSATSLRDEHERREDVKAFVDFARKGRTPLRVSRAKFTGIGRAANTP